MRGIRAVVAEAASAILILAIHVYQGVLSPVLGPSCRFHPTCSRYAIEAIRLHGPWRGTRLATRRVVRCHPFHPGGIDLVPERGDRDGS